MIPVRFVTCPNCFPSHFCGPCSELNERWFLLRLQAESVPVDSAVDVDDFDPTVYGTVGTDTQGGSEMAPKDGSEVAPRGSEGDAPMDQSRCEGDAPMDQNRCEGELSELALLEMIE